MNVRIDDSWKEVLEDEFKKEYFKKLVGFVKEEYQNSKVYPHPKRIFNAFDITPFDKVKVAILGQDPYHGPNQANGLAFSVNEDVPIPPSLKNIYKEIEDDLGKKVPETGNLERWAQQGVLLLNATLTVKAGSPGSHQNKGWEEFTDAAIKKIAEEKKHVVFMLWGNYAQKKGDFIDEKKHLVLKSAHPSPFSAERGFFGNRHFSKANAYLVMNNLEPIDW